MFAVEIIAASAKRYMPCCRLKSVQSPWHPADNIQLLLNHHWTMHKKQAGASCQESFWHAVLLGCSEMCKAEQQNLQLHTDQLIKEQQ